MADAPRRADAVWTGSLAKGSGEVSLMSSGAAGPLPVTWASRTERSNGKTSPEELVAAAHAACYSMALSHGLSEAGTPPTKLETSVTVTFKEIEGGWKVGTSEIAVRGTVPGMDEAAFRRAAEAAKDGCPISGALKGNVELSVTATLAKG
jgi:osmotically inducible protein OsmC